VRWRRIATAALLTACAREIPTYDRPAAQETALRFARHLTARRYDSAHALLTADEQTRVSTDSLRRAFETAVPPAFVVTDTLSVGATNDMADWPQRRATDLGWVYVVIPGAVYSEGVSVVVVRDPAGPRVRGIAVGRP
jgi:hypothetical protein